MRGPRLAVAVLTLPFALGPVESRARNTTLAVAGAANQAPAGASLGAFVAVAWAAQPPTGGHDIYLAVSRDGGHAFGDPVRVNAVAGEARVGGELPPRVALVGRAGAEPEILVAYGAKATHTEIKLARSVDGGRTFSTGRALQAPGAPGDRGWHAMTVDRRGVAHVMWLDHRGLAGGGGQPPREAEAIDGVALARRSGLYYATGDPANPSERELLNGVCYCCKVALAAGPRGGLFAAWRHVYDGSVRDIAFISSRDGGRTFDVPGRVSEDGWHLAGCPDDGPAMAVDDEGVVHVVWPTVVPGPTPEGAIFYASSPDGRTFSPRTRVPTLGSPRPMHPQILAAPERVVVAWDEVIDGIRQAAVRTVRFDEAGQPLFGATTRLGLPDTPASYPMLIATPSGTLVVYVSGKPGATILRTAVL